MKERLFTRNFTLLVLGQASSLLGNLVLRFALSMYVLETTGSAAVFAGILSAATIPTILLSPLGGVLADRANRRKVMVVLDALTGLSVLGTTLLLSVSGSLAVIATLLVTLSVLGAFETPTVQACLPQMLTGDNITKGNAVISQIASISTLTAPMLGSLLYVAFGLRPVMYASVACFLLTALLECFIQLGGPSPCKSRGILSMVKRDLEESMVFITQKEPGIFQLLLFSALCRFFVMGTAMVGLPYLVRTVLGLSAAHYGAAESALAVATILGSLAAELLTGKLKPARLPLLPAALGGCLVLAGGVFLVPASTTARYGVLLAAFCGVQAAVSIFSIFAVSLIQQRTPNALIGKVMAYTAAITLCAQPLGQALYGLLFDSFSSSVYLVLIPTGLLVCAAGLWAAGCFKSLAEGQNLHS